MLPQVVFRRITCSIELFFEETLILFDEIQECPEALNSLKYFKESASNYHIIAAGMLLRVYNVSKMEHPLAAFDKLDQFKLFFFDTGLLKCMAGIDNSAVLLKADYQFKGPLTENYVLQQLHGQFEIEPRYYSDKNSEIDFILQSGTEIIPVEAKGGEDKSAPSFKRYIAEHHPEHALRFSKRGYRRDGRLTNLPLYLACKTRQLL